MTGRIVVAVSLLFVMNLMMACFALDCPSPSSYYLKDISTQAIDLNINTTQGNNYLETVHTDTLRNQLAFETNSHIEFAALEKPAFEGFMNVAYGCIENILLNPVILNESSFSTNRPIYTRDEHGMVMTEYIPAFTNLLADARAKDKIEFPASLALENEAVTRVDINNNLVFEQGDYEFYFKWQTSDGIELSDTVRVYLAF